MQKTTSSSSYFKIALGSKCGQNNQKTQAKPFQLWANAYNKHRTRNIYSSKQWSCKKLVKYFQKTLQCNQTGKDVEQFNWPAAGGWPERHEQKKMQLFDSTCIAPPKKFSVLSSPRSFLGIGWLLKVTAEAGWENSSIPATGDANRF